MDLEVSKSRETCGILHGVTQRYVPQSDSILEYKLIKAARKCVHQRR